MKKEFAYTFAAVVALAMVVTFSSSVQASTRITVDDDKWLNIGYGLKTSYRSVEDASPDKANRSNEFSLQNIRLYLTSQLRKGLKITFNTDFNSNENKLILMDGVVKFRFSNWFNVWGGRFHIPSDRTNHSGPFHLNAWDLPFVQRIPNIAFGRDNGAAVWGTTPGGHFKYQFGVFEGRNDGTNSDTNPNKEDNPLFAGKLQYNLWDPEPGYGNKNSYFGEKDILAVALVLWHQENGAGTAEKPGDLTQWSIDFLMEKKLANQAVVTLDFTYYNYDIGQVEDAKLIEGDAFYISLNYMLPKKYGWGRIQPYVRYQEFNRENTNRLGERGNRDRIEGGFNYIIDGHNAKFAVFYHNESPAPGMENIDTFKIGAQLQF